MQEGIRNVLIIFTTVITSIGVCIKVIDNFPINIIKINYKSIPAKQSLFNIVISLIFCLVISFGILMTIIEIGYCFKEGFNKVFQEEFLLKINNFTYILGVIIALLFYFVLFVIICNFFVIRKKFIDKLQGKCGKVKKVNIVFNTICMIYCCLIILGYIIYLLGTICSKIKIVKDNGAYIFENYMDVGEMKNFIGITCFAFICLSFLILLNSLRNLCKAVNEEVIYILITNKESIICKSYLDYDEYYLIFENNNERYIKKSEIKEVRKKQLKNNKTVI